MSESTGETRRPNKAIITTTNENDEHVKMLREHYEAMGLAYQIIVVKQTEDNAIDIRLFLNEELLDCLGCPHKG